jgi:hypothetical protein
MGIDSGFRAQISLFAQLDDDQRTVLAQSMQERQVKPGDRAAGRSAALDDAVALHMAYLNGAAVVEALTATGLVKT